jgi:hypothetical protein
MEHTAHEMLPLGLTLKCCWRFEHGAEKKLPLINIGNDKEFYELSLTVGVGGGVGQRVYIGKTASAPLPPSPVLGQK